MFDFKKYSKERWEKIRSDPDLLKKHLAQKKESDSRLRKSAEYVDKKKAYARRYMNTMRLRIKNEEPAKYAALLERERAASKRKKTDPKYREYHRRWSKKHYENNISSRIALLLRNSLNTSLRGREKKGRAIALLGCSIEEFKIHIESQFVLGMSWGNRGMKDGQWSLDHIKPCAAFNLSKESEQRKCFHFSNIRPYWHIENVRKSSTFKGKYHFHRKTKFGKVLK